MSESEIIKQVLEGDRNLFRLLVEKYQSMIFRTCMGFMHNKDDAEDLVQEIFIQTYQSLATFKGNSAFSTWIYRIAVNAALNKVRKTSKSYILQRIDDLFGNSKTGTFPINVTDTENPENIIIGNEHREFVQNALNSLPENQRTAIVLSKYDDLPQKEIANIMGVSEGAVEALLQRAKANLREKLLVFSKKK